MKQAMREEMRRMRAALDPDRARAAGAAAQARLTGLPEFTRAKRVACYRSVSGEPETAAIFQACWAAGKETALPARHGTGCAYALCRYGPATPMRRGALGIPEPAEPEWLAAADMDLIVVPGVAFDAQGGRLGHGMGCYDRLLAGAGRAFKAGFCFAWQVRPRVPTGPRDMAMDAVVTDQAIYRSDGRPATGPAAQGADMKNGKQVTGEN